MTDDVHEAAGTGKPFVGRVKGIYEIRGGIRPAPGSSLQRVDWVETVKGDGPFDPAAELIDLQVIEEYNRGCE